MTVVRRYTTEREKIMDSLWLSRYGAPRDGRSLTVGAAASATDPNTCEARRVIRLFPSTTGVRYRFSVDPLKDGDFEQWAKTWGKLATVWDSEGALLKGNGPWKERGSSGKVTLNKTTPLSGDRDLKLVGETSIAVNADFEAFTAGDADGWTLAAQGDGDWAEENTIKKEATSSLKMDGGTTGALSKGTVQIAVSAETKYAIGFWVYGDAASGGKIRVIDTVSGEYLTTVGAWQAGDAAYATQTAAAWAYFPLVFTTKAGATTLDIEVFVVANAGAAYFDAWMLAPQLLELSQVTFFNLKKSADYTIGFTHKEALGLGSIRFALRELSTNKWLQSGGTWGAGEYWRPVTPSSSSADVIQAFTAHTVNTRYQLLFSVENLSFASEYAQLDRVFIAEDALTTDAQLKSVEAEYVLTPGKGRISGIADGAATLEINELYPQ